LLFTSLDISCVYQNVTENTKIIQVRCIYLSHNKDERAAMVTKASLLPFLYIDQRAYNRFNAYQVSTLKQAQQAERRVADTEVEICVGRKKFH
jgi:hypothetical protein